MIAQIYTTEGIVELADELQRQEWVKREEFEKLKKRNAELEAELATWKETAITAGEALRNLVPRIKRLEDNQ